MMPGWTKGGDGSAGDDGGGAQAKHFERAPEIEAAALRGESPAIYARDGLWARALPGLYAIQGSPPAPANLHVQRGGRRAGGIHGGKSMHAFFYFTDHA